MAKSKTVKKVKGGKIPKSNVPEGPNNDVYRSIRYKADIKTA